ncbi:unnamed protein product [Vitrella brassicaformis CCMP3155]|uniref:Alpha-mannosidase n=2 Tax=Vitrella brassicaformis TaxID=1169539 RepID=A0A0G4H0N6_VITBC|nr:unnamed protein product [Vitrella brassicaformis CCMP3155]|eukprot:CEM37133.1 unnamed protein product [Vitrella brassicaformis CCMP3155]
MRSHLILVLLLCVLPCVYRAAAAADQCVYPSDSALFDLHRDGQQQQQQQSASDSDGGEARRRTDEADVVTVHLIHHTHDDVGWLKTVDQYHMGLNNSIQWAYVSMVLDTVTDAVDPYHIQYGANPYRKFTYVEMGFFWRWWRQQSRNKQRQVHRLVMGRRLQFVNGGWCMHDEAAAHYSDMIQQMTFGHLFLLKTFRLRPTIGWQIDPFGHSATNAYLSTLMGFDGWFFARMDYQEKARRVNDRSLEMVMHPRDPSDRMVGGGIYTMCMADHYCSPPGFCADHVCRDQLIQDDPRLDDYNVEQRATEFLKHVEEYHKAFRTSHLLVPMGCDFTHSDAALNFAESEKLMRYINQRSSSLGYRLIYSTPAQYLASIHDTHTTLPIKETNDDFFPYADGPHRFWTGYFTTRPTFKRYVRECSALLQAYEGLIARHMIGHIDSTTRWPTHRYMDHSALFDLRERLAIAQHHDAVSGTAKQHVSDDYTKSLADARHRVEQAMGQIFAHHGYGYPDQQVPFEPCPYANISVCHMTEHLTPGSNASVVVGVYNPLAWTRHNVTVSFPVPTANLSVSGGYTFAVEAAWPFPSDQQPTTIPGRQNYTLKVSVPDIPPLSFVYFTVNVTKEGRNEPAPTRTAAAAGRVMRGGQQHQQQGGPPTTIESDVYRLTFDASGSLTSITNKPTNTTVDARHTMQYYRSFGPDSDQNSGAYIFRPNTTDRVKYDAPVKAFQVTRSGPWECLVQLLDGAESASCDEANWPAFFRYCVTDGSDAIDVDWSVGPIYIDDKQGKEFVSMWSLPAVNSSAAMAVDSNGLAMVRRTRDQRQSFALNVTDTEAGNYYPINSAAYVEDASTGVRFTVLVDRAQGAASLADGQIETMIHRRTVYDDNRGVAEPINETHPMYPTDDGKGLRVRGTHRVVLSTDTAIQRALEQEIYHDPIVMFASSPPPAAVAQPHVAMIEPLPRNLHLLTFSPVPWFGGRGRCCERGRGRGAVVLVRLRHLYDVGEDANMSVPVQYDLAGLFPGVSPQQLSARETTVTANSLLHRAMDRRMVFPTQSDTTLAAFSVHGDGDESTLLVTMLPGEIRTWSVLVRPRYDDLSLLCDCEEGVGGDECVSYWDVLTEGGRGGEGGGGGEQGSDRDHVVVVE